MSKVQNYRAEGIEDGRFIQAAIDNGIRQKAEELIAKHKKQLEYELNQAVSDVVAHVSLRIASELSFQDMGKTIRFEISKKFETLNTNKDGAE